MFNVKNIGAALLGGTFCFISAVSSAQVPIVRSQADHVASSQNAVPLNRQQGNNGQVDSALMESLIFQMQDMQSLVAEQRGIIEELSYQVQILQQEQKERYVDLDRRIQLLQEQASSQATQSTAVAPPAAQQQETALTDEEILAEYNAATALMQERKFDESISQLAVFAKKHPQHPLTPNAWYWIGEIYLVQRQTAEAQAAFERILSDYSTHDKMPDSLYKLGVIAQQGSNPDIAKGYFERVLTEFPNSQSAKLASARLNSN